MANFTAKDVNELRKSTGVGMMDCKKALTEADGDVEKAIELLREKGLATQAKKAGRVAAEGMVVAKVNADNSVGCVVEVNSETDFVANTDEFKAFVNQVADTIIEKNPADVETLKATTVSGGTMTVDEALQELFLKIRENLQIRRFVRMEGILVPYIHGGGKIGVMVRAESPAGATPEVLAAAKDCALQVAAMNPQYISRNDISAEELAKIKEITIDSALNDATTLPKPILNKLLDKAIGEKVWSDEDINNFEEHKSNMNYVWNFLSDAAKVQLGELAMADKASITAEKMFGGLVEGRVSKQLKEICLLDQTYVKAEDGKQSVAKYLESVSKDLKITKMIRFEVGEGMEKKQEDFAAEVAAQMNA